jgi:hypothetical protein
MAIPPERKPAARRRSATKGAIAATEWQPGSIQLVTLKTSRSAHLPSRFAGVFERGRYV